MQHSAELSAAAAAAAARMEASGRDLYVRLVMRMEWKPFLGWFADAIACLLRYNLPPRHIRDSVINRSDLWQPIERYSSPGFT